MENLSLHGSQSAKLDINVWVLKHYWVQHFSYQLERTWGPRASITCEILTVMKPTKTCPPLISSTPTLKKTMVIEAEIRSVVVEVKHYLKEVILMTCLKLTTN